MRDKWRICWIYISPELLTELNLLTSQNERWSWHGRYDGGSMVNWLQLNQIVINCDGGVVAAATAAAANEKDEGEGEEEDGEEKEEHKRECIDRIRPNGSMEGWTDWAHWSQSSHSWWPLSKARKAAQICLRYILWTGGKKTTTNKSQLQRAVSKKTIPLLTIKLTQDQTLHVQASAT